MDKLIKCPKCSSTKLALSDAGNEYLNICNLLCLDCAYVFKMSKGILTDNESGNVNKLLLNLYELGEIAKARWFCRELFGFDKKEARAYMDQLVST